MHLALGNLSHRHREIWDGKEPTQAEPLGIATDGRWMWHEFGHVLLIATPGELELRFAHSPGDAPATILADPYSRLADLNALPVELEPTVGEKKEGEREKNLRGRPSPGPTPGDAMIAPC